MPDRPTDLFQPYYDICEYAKKRIAEARDEQIEHCRSLLMEDEGQLADWFRSEYFERFNRNGTRKPQPKGPGRYSRR